MKSMRPVHNLLLDRIPKRYTIKVMTFYPLYPIYPYSVNQGWGTLDPKDYSQFGFTRHNGVDLKILGSDMQVRAPFSGTVIRVGNQPTGGGIFLGLLSDDDYEFESFTCMTPGGVIVEFPATTCKVLIDFLHLEKVIAVEGQHYNERELLAIPDNTGFSTGPHCHTQWRREILEPAPANTLPSYRVLGNNILVDVDKNDANNSFDPTQFWSGSYANTDAHIETVLNAAADVVNKINVASVPTPQKSTWLQSIFAALKSLKGRL